MPLRPGSFGCGDGPFLMKCFLAAGWGQNNRRLPYLSEKFCARINLRYIEESTSTQANPRKTIPIALNGCSPVRSPGHVVKVGGGNRFARGRLKVEHIDGVLRILDDAFRWRRLYWIVWLV